MLLSTEEWMDLRAYRALREAGATWAEIARETGHDWRTVKKYLSSDAADRPPAVTACRPTKKKRVCRRFRRGGRFGGQGSRRSRRRNFMHALCSLTFPTRYTLRRRGDRRWRQAALSSSRISKGWRRRTVRYRTTRTSVDALWPREAVCSTAVLGCDI